MTADRRRWPVAVAVAAIAVSLGVAVAVGVVAARRAGPGDPGRQPAVAPADPGPTAAPSSTRPPLDDPPDPGPAPEHHGLAGADLASAVESSVRIFGPGCRGIGHEGRGFAVRDGDLVATIAHLMVGMYEPTVELADGRELAGVAVAFDAVNDLAVLRVAGAGLTPLPLTEAVPDGTVGAVLTWEAEAEPDPTPFRIDRPVTVRTEIVAGDERVERPSWLLAADIEPGDSGAALVTSVEGRTVAVGVAWGASRRGGVDVAYATRAGALDELLASSDLTEPVDLPDCR